MRASRHPGDALARAGQAPNWPETLIRPERDSWSQYAREVLQSSELVYLLLWRNIKLRYRHTIIGAGWAVLQPLLTMLVFTVLFGRLVKIPTGDVPYPIFALSGLVPWTYFVHALTLSTKSLVDHHELINRVYFPRAILPFVAVTEAGVDFLIAFSLLAVMAPFFGLKPGWHLLLLPLVFLLLMSIALGVGLWLAALNLRYRDIASAMPFVIQLFLFVTPVAYPSSLVPARWRDLYALNPLAGVMDTFRWALFGVGSVSLSALGVSILAAVSVLASGLIFFQRREDYFPDEG